MEKQYAMLITTCGTQENARQITESLLEKRLVACVQESKIFSSYIWEGKIERNEEFILKMKTKKSLYKEVEQEILRLHNYEVPEIAMFDIVDGNQAYLDWIEKETK